MALDTFTPSLDPSYSSSTQGNYKILQADFADGYTQRASAGLNNKPVSANLRWDTLTVSQAQDIQDFFDDHYGVIAFYYTLPRESTPRKFTVESWTRTAQAPNSDTFTATFKEQFDLGS